MDYSRGCEQPVLFRLNFRRSVTLDADRLGAGLQIWVRDKRGSTTNMILLHGFALTLLGGVTVGFSAWSLKWARIWKFENYWLMNCILSLIILPFLLAYWLLPHLVNVYASLGAS